MFTLRATYGIRNRRRQASTVRRIQTSAYREAYVRVREPEPSLEVTVEHKVEHEERKMEAVLQLVARKVEWHL